MSSGECQQGFTYLGALLLIAVVGAGLASLEELWSQSRQRAREAELIWVGNQFKQAIGAYYERSPGSVKNYPEKLEDLLEDPRYLFTVRHLRRIYSDPITGKPDWIVDPAPAGGIKGVRSRSTERSIRALNSRQNYNEWDFMYEPQAPINRPR